MSNGNIDHSSNSASNNATTVTEAQRIEARTELIRQLEPFAAVYAQRLADGMVSTKDAYGAVQEHARLIRNTLDTDHWPGFIPTGSRSLLYPWEPRELADKVLNAAAAPIQERYALAVSDMSDAGLHALRQGGKQEHVRAAIKQAAEAHGDIPNKLKYEALELSVSRFRDQGDFWSAHEAAHDRNKEVVEYWKKQAVESPVMESPKAALTHTTKLRP